MNTADILNHIITSSAPLAVDTETSGRRWWRDVMGVMSFAWGGDEEESWATRNVMLATSALQARMDAGRTVVFHNCQFDLHFLQRRGLRINWDTVQDTLLMARLKNNLGDNGLKELGKSELGIYPTDKDLLRGWLTKNKSDNYLDVPDEILLPYAQQDTRLTIQLYYVLKGQTHKPLYERELVLRRKMFDAETLGVQIDPEECERRLAWAESERQSIDDMLQGFHPAGQKFKITSDAQVRKWLYDDLGMTPVSFTPTGLAQVNAFNLSSNPHPITRLLMARNKREDGAKFFRAYLDFMDNWNRLHPNINTMMARTHRFSCSDPNLQQIPSRNDRFHTREVFNSGDGWFVGADFDKQELFIAACEAGETALMQELAQGLDPYKKMAAAMLQKPVESITGSERQAAKVAILSMLYGAGAPKVAESFTLNTGKPYTVEQAKVIRDNFYIAYPGLKKLMNKMQGEARNHGGVRNRWDRWLNVETERAYVATDYLVQSSGRDVLGDAIINVDEVLPEVGGRLLWPIHDEVISWIPEEPSPAFLKRFAEAMVCNVWQLPLTAKPKFGKSLANLK